MIALKQTCGGYIVAGPRKNRKEGVCYSRDKSDAMIFKSPIDANAWLVAIQQKQRKLGMKSYEIARAYPVNF